MSSVQGAVLVHRDQFGLRRSERGVGLLGFPRTEVHRHVPTYGEQEPWQTLNVRIVEQGRKDEPLGTKETLDMKCVWKLVVQMSLINAHLPGNLGRKANTGDVLPAIESVQIQGRKGPRTFKADWHYCQDRAEPLQGSQISEFSDRKSTIGSGDAQAVVVFRLLLLPMHSSIRQT